MANKNKQACKIKRFFCQTILCKSNIKRDFALISIIIVILAFFIIFIQLKEEQAKRKEAIKAQALVQLMPNEEEVYHQVKTIQENIDTSSWKNYQSHWYGFEVSYPTDWAAPKNENGSRATQWEYRYQFRKNNPDENDPFLQ